LDALGASILQWIRGLPVRRRLHSGVTRVVAVSGPPGLGKSALCRNLHAAHASIAALNLDGYLLERSERRRLGVCGADREGYHSARAARDIRSFVLDGKAIFIPPYLPTGTCGEAVEIALRPIILLDGALAQLCPEILAVVDATVFFLADPATMRTLRIDRDTRERRCSSAEARLRWRAEWPALRDNALPLASDADLIVRPTVDREYMVEPGRRKS
jgi:uridine kinase